MAHMGMVSMSRDADQDRHDRRMMLMRMRGTINRQERRADRWMLAAMVLAFLAFVLMVFA